MVLEKDDNVFQIMLHVAVVNMVHSHCVSLADYVLVD